ncbi:MAG: NAD(P)H-dependent oxidoreductase [Alteromonas sp.]|nr:NAD(P)H-dependent oxidoreductase [Alteromonas sp.]
MASQVIKKLQWRYACKKFDPSKILSEEQLDILKNSFNLTATSYGLQPLKLVVVSDSETKEQLVPISFNQAQVRDASHVLILCTEKNISTEYIKAHFEREEAIRNTPRKILEPFEKFLIDDFAAKTPEAISQWMVKQAYLALGNLLTVCALEGIDACPMEGFQPEAYDTLLGLDALGLESVLVLPVGYRAEDDFFATLKKVRRGGEEVIVEL